MFIRHIALLSCIIAIVLPGKAYGRLGYIDKTGKVVITLNKEVTWVSEFGENGLAAVNEGGSVTIHQSFDGGKWGFIDRSGKLVIPFKFDRVRAFHEGMCAVAIDKKWGFIDQTGKIRIPLKFFTARDFSGGLASVGFNWDRQFFIDKAGKIVIPDKYGGWSTFSEGLAWVSVPTKGINRQQMGYIDRTGKLAIEPRFTEAQEFSEGLARVMIREQNGSTISLQYGYIDKLGKMVILLSEPGENFIEDLARCYHKGKWGYIDRRGRFVIQPRFDWCLDFSEGLALVQYCESGKMRYAYVDSSDRLTFPPSETQECTTFSEGLAAFRVGARMDPSYPIPLGGKWGFIDKKGKIVIEPRFANFLQSPSRFNHGLAAVSID